MSDQSDPYSAEIDLFEMLQIVWNGKVLIVLTTVLAMIGGLVIGHIIPARYNMTVPFTINYHSLKSGYSCALARNKDQCKQRIDFEIYVENTKIDLRNGVIVYKHSIGSVSEAERLSQAIQDRILEKSKEIFVETSEQLVYVNTLGNGGDSTETVVRQKIALNNLIRQYQKGIGFASLRQTELKNIFPAPAIVTAIVAFAALMLACLFVLVRNAYFNWKSSQVP